MDNFDDHPKLNHNFYSFLGEDFAICKVCKLRVFINYTDFEIFRNNQWHELDITCEEMQIKNLLE